MTCLKKSFPVYYLSAAMGAIFGMTTCLSAQARDAPDDPTNYFIGGCASGIFLGARSEFINQTQQYSHEFHYFIIQNIFLYKVQQLCFLSFKVD